MDVKELKDEIKKLNQNLIDYSENDFGSNLQRDWLIETKSKLEGIKQTVEAVDKYMELANPSEDYVIWQEIKNLLKL